MGYPKRSSLIMVLTLWERLEQSWNCTTLSITSLQYGLQTNEAVEAADKNIKNILAKMVVTYKDWAEKLPPTL